MSDTKIVYRLTNSQRMALCTLILEYAMKLRDDRNVLPERFIDCSVENDEGLTPFDLLNIFMDTSEIEALNATYPGLRRLT